MTVPSLPGQRHPIAGNLTCTPEFYRVLQQLADYVRIQQANSGNVDNSALQDQITRLFATLGPILSTNGTGILTRHGPQFAFVKPDDSANVTLTLDYSTDTLTADLTDLSDTGAGSLLAITVDAKGRVTGTRAATITGTTGEIDISDGDASSGPPTISLSDVSVTAGGSIKKRSFDAKGRLSQESAATTDDLTEGATNQWFTAARVRSAVLTGLSLATSAVIAATDTVLGALGKLQAQINGKAPSIQTGSHASRPSASDAPGVLYYATDVQESYLSDGSAWNLFGGAGSELGYAEITVEENTSSSSLVDVPGLSVTFVAGERPVMLCYGGAIKNNTTGAFARLQAIADGFATSNITVPGTGSYLTQTRETRITGLTPGSTYIFKLQFQAIAGGTTFLYGDPNDRPFIQVRSI